MPLIMVNIIRHYFENNNEKVQENMGIRFRSFHPPWFSWLSNPCQFFEAVLLLLGRRLLCLANIFGVWLIWIV